MKKNMDFKIERKGYSVAEVDAYFASQKSEYERALMEQRERINEQKKRIDTLEKENKEFQNKSELVSKAIMSAVSKAEEIEKLSQIKYNQEITQLKAFHEKWTAYYNKILDSYPLDEALAAAGKFNRQMGDILSRASKSGDMGELFSVTDSREFKRDDTRAQETQIGYIKVKTDDSLSAKNKAVSLSDIVPGADPNSPIMSGNFDPIDRISRYLKTDKQDPKPQDQKPQPIKPQDPKQQPIKPQDPKQQPIKPQDLKQQDPKQQANENQPTDYPDRSPSGFSFLEAQNPKENLEEIMKDLGLL